MTGLETWTPRVQGLPDEKNVVHGLGQFCLILYGKTPGMLQKCRNVEIRLAWMATRFPPTPVRTKQSKPVKNLHCSRKHQPKTQPKVSPSAFAYKLIGSSSEKKRKPDPTCHGDDVLFAWQEQLIKGRL